MKQINSAVTQLPWNAFQKLKTLFFSLALLLPIISSAQYSVDFDGSGETKASYASGSVTLSGISWNMAEALIGNLSNDYFNGVRSARLRGYGTSVMYMEADKANGIGTVSFTYRRYGSDAASSYAVEYSTNSGSSWTQIGSTITSPATVTSFSEVVNVSGNVRLRIRCTSGGTSNRRMNVEDILITDYAGSTPSIAVSPSSLSGFSANLGNASASQSYDLSGSNLTPTTGNITVTAPADYEVSTNNSTFNNSLTVAYTGGTLGSTTIYVRMKSSASLGVHSGNVTNAGGSASTENVAVSGSVVVPATPSLIFTHADADVETMELLTLQKITLNSVGITDNGLCSGGAFRNNEGSLTFPSSGFTDIPAGTFVRVKWDGTGSNETDFTDGLISVFPSSSIGGLNASGEQLLVYTGSQDGSTSCANPNGNNTFLTGINWGNSGWITSSEPSASESYAPGTPTDFDPNTTDDALEFDGSVTGNVSTLIAASGSGIRNFSNWASTTSGTGTYSLKSILFNQSDFSSGSLTFSSVGASGFTINASGLSFGSSNTDTRYMVVMYPTAPGTPVDRYTCYSNISANYAAADDVVTSVANQSATNFCGTPTTGNGKVVYFDYSLPSALAISGLAPSTTYQVRVYAVNGNGYTANIGTSASGSQATIAGPSLLTSVGSLTGFSTVSGTASISQSYDLSGSNLSPASGNITVTAPTDFEVSTNNSTFGNSVTVAYTGSAFSATPVYVRIKASAGVGSPSGNVSNAGGSATTVNVAVDGTVTAPIVPPSVVVNKYDHSNDIIELLVITNNLDMRNMVIKDFSSNNANDNGGKSTFGASTLWSSVPSGTLIILRPDNSAADVSHADGNYTIDVGALNNTYFTGSLTAMNPSSDDMIMIKTGTEAGTSNNIHTLCGGSAGTQFNAISGGYVQRGSNSSGFVYVDNSTSSLADYNDNSEVSTTSSTLTFGEPNTTTNQTYICSLRGATEPTANASGVNFTGVTTSSITVNWANPGSGGGARRIVVARATSTASVAPTDGVDYNTSTVFTTPATPDGVTGAGNVVVYDGTGTSVTVTNLASNTNYTFTIYEYNGVNFCTDYRTTGASGAQTTLAGGNSTVNFVLPTSSTVNEGVGTVTLTFSITNPSPSAATTAQVALTGGTGSAADVNNYTTQTITFPGNSTANQTVTLTVTDDALFESVETLVFSLQNVAGGQGTPTVGVNGTYTLSITDNDVPNIVINELHYNPSGVQGADSDYEFLELYNAEGVTVDLSGYTFSQGITYTFPPGTTIDPGEYIIISQNASSYSGNGYDVYQWTSGGLSNSGETVELQTPGGTTVDIVTYGTGSPWPGDADGNGPSLELAATNLDNSQASNWHASYFGYGTPGATNSTPVTVYYSQGTGNHGDAIWSPYPVGTPGVATFDETISFVIQNGHTITLNNSGTNIKNLTVNTGGTLLANTTNTNPTYFDIYGDLVCNGTIGGPTNGMAFDFEGTNQTLTGTGSMTVTRIRKDDSDNTTTNLTISKNITFVYGGTCLYNNQNGTIFNVTLAPGFTLDVNGSNGTNGSVSIDDTDGVSVTSDKGGSLTINGTLNISNALYARSDNPSSQSCSLTIGQFGKIVTKDAIVNIDGTSFTGFTINTGGKFEINGVLMVQGGTLTSPANLNGGSLVVKNNASVLHGVGTPNGGGSISGPVIVKRNGSNGVYNFWSSPVVGQNVGIMGGTVYVYDPSLGTADPSDDQPADPGWVAPGTTMQAGTGYAGLGSGNLSFYGNLHDGNYSVPVSSHSSPNVSYNLVGNPYPSAISALDFLTANSGVIQGAVYYWDDDNSGGAGYASNDYAVRNFAGSTNGGGGHTAPLYIASGQGFKVRATTNGSINFTNTLRNTTINNAFLSQGNNSKIWLSVSNPDNYYNQTLLAFMIDGTEGEDWAYDAEKIRLATSLSLYSFLDDKALAIQGFPELTNDRVIPLGLISASQSNVTFHIDSTYNIEQDVDITLEDRYFSQFYDLKNNDYTFLASETEYTDRFFLHINHAVTVGVSDEELSKISIYTNGNRIFVNPGNVEGKAQISLMNNLGQTILTNELLMSGLTSVELPELSTGVYVVRVIAGNTVKSKQIFINK